MRNDKRPKKLTVAAHTIRALDVKQLTHVVGGAATLDMCKYRISVGFCD